MKKRNILVFSLIFTMLAASGCVPAENTSEGLIESSDVVSESVTEISAEESVASEITELVSEAVSEVQTEGNTYGLSQESFSALSAFRKDLEADGGYLGAAFLGCAGTYSGCTKDDILEISKKKFSGEVFTDELDSLAYIEQEGEEMYLLVPADEKAVISVYEQIWGDSTEDGMPARGQLLYEASAGEPVIVKGNISDIVSSFEIAVNVNGEEKIYHPSLSLENGRLSKGDGVVDFSRYDSNELTFTSDTAERFTKYDWQRAYTAVILQTGGEFAIYDIDKDGSPELLLKTGTCEADYVTEVYYMNGDEAVSAGTTYSGHTGYYTYPDGNGFVYQNAHMGYSYIGLLTLENGEIKDSDAVSFEEDINGDPDADYTPVSKVVNGASWLPMHYPDDILHIYDEGRTLPTCGYLPLSHEEIEERADAVTDCTCNFFCVHLDHWKHDNCTKENGEITMMTLYEGHGIFEYSDGEAKLDDRIFYDINGDGQEECILLFSDTSTGNTAFVILSVQNGNVYGYVSEEFYSGKVSFDNGKLKVSYNYGNNCDIRVSFYLDKCYEEYYYSE